MDPGPAMMAGHGGSLPLPASGERSRLLAPRTPAGRLSSRCERRTLLVLRGIRSMDDSDSGFRSDLWRPADCLGRRPRPHLRMAEPLGRTAGPPGSQPNGASILVAWR